MDVTVGKLIERLQQLMVLNKIDIDTRIILQKDGEGNGFSPLAEIDGDCLYIPTSTWSGRVYDTTWSSYDADMPESEWENFKKENEKVVVLCPTN